MWQNKKNKHIKTLNLEQLGVQEMDAKEVKGTEGGIPPFWLGVLGGVVAAAIVSIDSIVEGAVDGWNAYEN